jgi:putative transposase
MPSRNILKIDAADVYYHVYARGNNKAEIFLDTEDYNFFVNLFKRYLSRKQQFDKFGAPYSHLFNRLELICYCLMPNHFHLLVYQVEQKSMKVFMQSLLTSYSRYFNKKYSRSGSLFETRYKASLIYNQGYLEHITRYIHLNPKHWRDHPYSSLSFYLGRQHAEWLRLESIMSQFDGTSDYLSFLEDYEDNKRMIDELKHELASDY